MKIFDTSDIFLHSVNGDKVAVITVLPNPKLNFYRYL